MIFKQVPDASRYAHKIVIPNNLMLSRTPYTKSFMTDVENWLLERGIFEYEIYWNTNDGDAVIDYSRCAVYFVREDDALIFTLRWL